MGYLANLIASTRRGPNDEIATPDWAVDFLVPYLPPAAILWESAPGLDNRLSKRLHYHGFVVKAVAGPSFFEVALQTGLGRSSADWDVQVTHPPYSKKAKWLAHSNFTGKPWALLLPVTSLASASCRLELEGCEILFLPRRVDFTGKGRPWCAVAWFTKGLALHPAGGRRLTGILGA